MGNPSLGAGQLADAFHPFLRERGRPLDPFYRPPIQNLLALSTPWGLHGFLQHRKRVHVEAVMQCGASPLLDAAR